MNRVIILAIVSYVRQSLFDGKRGRRRVTLKPFLLTRQILKIRIVCPNAPALTIALILTCYSEHALYFIRCGYLVDYSSFSPSFALSASHAGSA